MPALRNARLEPFADLVLAVQQRDVAPVVAVLARSRTMSSMIHAISSSSVSKPERVDRKRPIRDRPSARRDSRRSAC